MMKNLSALFSLALFFFGIGKVDAQNPYTLTCKAFTVVTLADEGEATVDASLFVQPDDACCPLGSVSYEARISGTGNFGSLLDLDCTNQGQTAIEVRATDCVGYEHTCETFVIVQANIGNCDDPCPGCCAPVVVTEPLFVAISANESVTITTEMFDQGSFSPCGNEPLSFSFSPSPGDDVRTFTCDDIGIVPTSLFVTDANGTLNIAETYVLVSDNEGACASGACLPAPRVHNALVVSMQYDSSPTCISASDYEIASGLPDCSSANSYSLAFSSDPTDTEKCFTCSDLGTNEIDLYIIDDEGNYNSIKVAAIVQAFYPACGSFIASVTNDNVCDAIDVDGIFGEGCGTAFYNWDATTEPNEPEPGNGDCTAQNAWCDDGADNTVWFTFTGPPAGVVTIFTDAFVNSPNTQLALWEADDCSEITGGTATLVAANDDNPSGGTDAYIEAECLTEGQTYFLQVDGFEGAIGGFVLTLFAEGDPCPGLTNGGGQLECGVADVPPVVSTGMGEWLHLRDVEGNLVASINDRGQELGEVTADLMINAGDVRTDDNGNHYLDRNWVIEPAQQPDGNVLVRFYFSTDELAALVSASPMVDGADDLEATKISGAACGDYGGLPGEILEPNSVYPYSSDWMVAEFEVNSFSAFYINGPQGLTLTGDPFPVNTLSIYPNPVSETLSFDVPSGFADRSPTYEVLDANGKTVMENAPLTTSYISIGDLSQGIYFLKIMTGDEVMVKRFLKMD